MRSLHVETHFSGGQMLRDGIIGMSDGLTVPFALAAGLSGAIHNSHIVVTAGLAELAAGAISMGLGGYLASQSQAETYVSERKREVREVKEIPEEEIKEVKEVFQQYGLTDAEIEPILKRFQDNHVDWVDFMMRFELGIEKPEPRQALYSALVIGGSYAVGGLIPLAPYIAVSEPQQALLISVGVTLSALFVFGFAKAKFTGAKKRKSAVQTVLVGGVAAAVAYMLAKLVAG
jgi:vacuolar iron transporter family protein